MQIPPKLKEKAVYRNDRASAVYLTDAVTSDKYFIRKSAAGDEIDADVIVVIKLNRSIKLQIAISAEAVSDTEAITEFLTDEAFFTEDKVTEFLKNKLNTVAEIIDAKIVERNNEKPAIKDPKTAFPVKKMQKEIPGAVKNSVSRFA